MTLRDFEACVAEANKRTKTTLGHTFTNPIRPQCVHCGRSDRAETKCPKEHRTFVMRLTEILMENGTISHGATIPEIPRN